MMSSLSPPPGFRGLDAKGPLKIYHRNFPHWRQDGATYFVTLRLADSLPQSKLNELREIREAFSRRHSQSLSTSQLEHVLRETMRKAERWLDQGYGKCWLRNQPARKMLEDRMLSSHGAACDLAAFVIMPNHGHVIVRPADPGGTPLELVLGRWKGASACEVNKLFGFSGPLWQQESFDRIIRDEEHLWNCLQYLGNNPRRAVLKPHEYSLWLNPAWEKLGWQFVTEQW